MRRALIVVALLSLGAGSAPSLAITPNPAHVGEAVSFSGCGYIAGKDVAVVVEPPSGTDWGFSTRVDRSGCFTGPAAYVPSVAGEHEVYVYPKTGSGVGTYGHHKALLEADLDVEP